MLGICYFIDKFIKVCGIRKNLRWIYKIYCEKRKKNLTLI